MYHGWSIQAMRALQYLVAMGGYYDILAPSHTFQTVHSEHRLTDSLLLRGLSFWIEPQTDFHDISWPFCPNWKVMEIPSNPAVGRHSHPSSFRKHLPRFADAIASKGNRATASFWNENRVAVVYDFLSKRVRGFKLCRFEKPFTI